MTEEHDMSLEIVILNQKFYSSASSCVLSVTELVLRW